MPPWNIALAPDTGIISTAESSAGRRVAPRDILAKARRLDDANNTPAALQLLLRHRGELAHVPPEYDAAIGRLSARSGDLAAGVDFLARACDRLGEAAPATLRRDLAMALLANGQTARAGTILHALLAEAEKGGAKQPVWARKSAVRHALDLHRDGVSHDAPSAQPAGGDAEPLRMVNHPFAWAPVAISLQRQSRRLQNSDAKIERLAKTRRGGDEAVPSIRRIRFGSALHAAGRIIEAGREFDLALSAGAQIDRLDFLLAIDAYRRDTGMASDSQ
jgi:hypothetical protein